MGLALQQTGKSPRQKNGALFVILCFYMIFSKESFIRSFRELSSPDPATKERANQHIIQLLETDEAWAISRVPIPLTQ